MTRTFRTGAIGAYLDEYERALAELKQVVERLPDAALTIVVDPHTTSPDCRSMQTVLSHIVCSGYGYATVIHNLKGPELVRPAKTFHATVAAYLADLASLFHFTEQVLLNFNDDELEELDPARKITARWGQVYDIDQMMEHAIVHVLRHRRQLEKFILLLNAQPALS